MGNDKIILTHKTHSTILLENLRTITLKINKIINDKENIITNQNNNKGNKFTHTMAHSISVKYLQYSSIELWSMAILPIYRLNIVAKTKAIKKQYLKIRFNISTMLYFYKYFQLEHRIR